MCCECTMIDFNALIEEIPSRKEHFKLVCLDEGNY